MCFSSAEFGFGSLSCITNGAEEWKDIPDINKDMNYKGVILRAFEQFRLKSCIDFKPRAAEDFYISVESREGCWSYVGRIFPGGQTLSIGNGCGIKAIVEHEFLHALGFWHEQSRYDRDDYVSIKFENIIKGYESNFDKYSENVTTTQGTPYDYYSVMHYDKNAFSNGNGSTIITKLPEFQDVIGQRLDISEYDAIELNKLYKCSSSISFLDHCSFDDESLCQMSVCSAADYGWQRVKSVSGINVTDHTYLGKEQNGTSFFMHFSTEGRNEGDTARMESKTMTPKRDCKVQCLQFYYYHSGNESDQLNIWIREYQNEADNRGTLRLMDQITDGIYYWDNPRKNGTRVTIGNETVYVGLLLGYRCFIMTDDLTRREFIKGGDIIFLFNMQVWAFVTSQGSEFLVGRSALRKSSAALNRTCSRKIYHFVFRPQNFGCEGKITLLPKEPSVKWS
ncbi:Meprin A subunit beta [Anabarilius grahami]|uniref:Metalloendopeptidase n=1 Tax=Anabarilius grahami TaxID=495550 RepID=A0A3N0YNR5_ANAGA|nr:Meprin A subunit beta [Anabarilius grahami]